MATLTVVELNDVAGLDLEAASLDALSVADQFLNDGRTVMVVGNTDASPHTPVFVAQKTTVTVQGLGDLTKANGGGAVAATTGKRVFGPFPPAIYNDGNGYLQMTLASATGMKGKAIRVVVK